MNFFFGGVNGDSRGVSNTYQDIDVSAFASLINGGALRFDLSGWIGGYYSQSDSVTISARFIDVDGNELVTGSIGPLTPAQRNSSRNLFFLATNGSVPSGTRTVRIRMDFTGGGRSLDGYADNLDFRLRLRSDVNGSGCVDDADLLAVLFAFGNSGSGLPEDLNTDGIVDDADLLEVLFTFGTGC